MIDWFNHDWFWVGGFKCDGATADEKHSSNELDPAQVDRFCRHHQFSGWFDTSAKNDINIDEAVQFLVGKVYTAQSCLIIFASNSILLGGI